MNALPRFAPMTVEQFFDWADARHDEERYELFGGVILAQSRQSLQHISAKTAIAATLANAIKKAGLPCSAVGDGAAVKIDAYTVFIPDALVYCGPRLPGKESVVPDPVIVVEVLSPTSIQRDMADKLAGYFRLPSVEHYLIVDPEAKRLFHHRRLAEGLAPPAILTEGALRLDAPGLAIEIADIFADL